MVVRSTVDLEGRRQALMELVSSNGSLRIEDLAARFQDRRRLVGHVLEPL